MHSGILPAPMPHACMRKQICIHPSVCYRFVCPKVHLSVYTSSSYHILGSHTNRQYYVVIIVIIVTTILIHTNKHNSYYIHSFIRRHPYAWSYARSLRSGCPDPNHSNNSNTNSNNAVHNEDNTDNSNNIVNIDDNNNADTTTTTTATATTTTTTVTTTNDNNDDNDNTENNTHNHTLVSEASVPSPKSRGLSIY